MARRDPEQSTLRLPSAQPLGAQEDTTLPLRAVRPSKLQGIQSVGQALTKVPEITLLFWVVKLLTTAWGESTSDYLVHRFDPVLAVIAGFVIFAAALLVQLVVRRYVAWVYWLAVAMVALFGTMAADVVHIVLKVPYLISTVAFGIALAIVLSIWYRTEHTLSIHSIYTMRRELFYWATVITTFALGTAAGDLTAYTFHLGFFAAGVLFVVLIAMPAFAYFVLRLNEVAAFWWAYILTRPVGAEFADWTGKPVSEGGLAIGQGKTSLVLAVLIIGFVAYFAFTRNDMQGARQAQ
jgi:uncharacterized membrane-anchored protein